MTLPADIEHAIADLIWHARASGATNDPSAHAVTAVARVSLETIIAHHLTAYAAMKAALEVQITGA